PCTTIYTLYLHDALPICILGEAGVGKTRLALAALEVSDLAPLVVYCDNPGTPFDDGLINDLVGDDNPFVVVLVVDECNADGKATDRKSTRLNSSHVENSY